MRNQRLLKNFGDFMNCLYQKGLTDQLSFGDIVLSFAFCVFEVLEVSDVCPILSSSSSCCLVFVFTFADIAQKAVPTACTFA